MSDSEQNKLKNKQLASSEKYASYNKNKPNLEGKPQCLVTHNLRPNASPKAKFSITG